MSMSLRELIHMQFPEISLIKYFSLHYHCIVNNERFGSELCLFYEHLNKEM